MGIDIDKKLTEAGYRMFGAAAENEDLILSILDDGNLRYLKAVPFLIYNYDIDLEKINSRTKQKKLLAQIISITRRMFKEEGIPKALPNIDQEGDFDYADFKQEFDMQKLASEKPKLLIDKQKIYAERDTLMWLSSLFTKKERQIIRRIFDDKPVSKTEYEYYSRKTKKKLHSIINLQELARTLANKSPAYDEELFKLKSSLEKWLENADKIEEASIQRFFIADDIISIFYNKKEPKEQTFNTQKLLKIIKDKDIIRLLDIYKEHDFT
ncbi:MAG: hypothetical protein ABIA62_03620 [Candidatus Woesearchaeota archaeon]